MATKKSWDQHMGEYINRNSMQELQDQHADEMAEQALEAAQSVVVLFEAVILTAAGDAVTSTPSSDSRTGTPRSPAAATSCAWAARSTTHGPLPSASAGWPAPCASRPPTAAT